ncbi:MAG TPA: hypothetical protein PKV41_04665 [Candidatus Omnitrophota bacterium]|nr:hypothetical protein [Candidatus Omnitrophota bacterium]
MKRQGIFLVLVMLMLLVGRGGFAQIAADEALSKFVEAGMAYQNEDYDTAIKKYEEILRGGRESGAVYYNLGNSYFRKGDLGRTVLNYERAMRLIPRDSDLKFNDRYLRARINAYDGGKAQSFLSQAIGDFVGFYTKDEMALIIAVLVLILAALFLLSLYRNWPKMRFYGIGTVLLVLILAYSLGLAMKVKQNAGLAVVVTATDALFEPRADSTVHFKLSPGAKATILIREGDWMKIRRLDGKVGWTPGKTLEEI